MWNFHQDLIENLNFNALRNFSTKLFYRINIRDKNKTLDLKLATKS